MHLRFFCSLAAILLAGCAYTGGAHKFDPSELDSDNRWIAVRNVPLVLQQEHEDCGAAALAMMLAYWREPTSLAEIESACPPVPDRGIKAGALRDFARQKGLRAFLFHGEMADLEREISRRRPVMVGLVKPYVIGAFTHYEVVVAIHPDRSLIVTLDPARGWRQNSFESFLEEWQPVGKPALVMFAASAEPPAQ
jgi:ABC-type bacteriocin/lantibiotic exporter with double-glycine peptidase domain